MSSVLDRGSPDFVVYLGDVVTANNIMVASASLYWDMAVSRARSQGFPFSSLRGNHDDAAFQWPVECSRHLGFLRFNVRRPIHLPLMVCPCEFQSKKTAASREHDACRSYLEGLSKAQVEWFRSKSHEIDPNSSVPELIFRHIPSKAYKKVAPGPGISKPCVGSMNMEKVAPQEKGVMELLENGLLSRQ